MGESLKKTGCNVLEVYKTWDKVEDFGFVHEEAAKKNADALGIHSPTVVRDYLLKIFYLLGFSLGLEPGFVQQQFDDFSFGHYRAGSPKPPVYEVEDVFDKIVQEFKEKCEQEESYFRDWLSGIFAGTIVAHSFACYARLSTQEGKTLVKELESCGIVKTKKTRKRKFAEDHVDPAKELTSEKRSAAGSLRTFIETVVGLRLRSLEPGFCEENELKNKVSSKHIRSHLREKWTTRQRRRECTLYGFDLENKSRTTNLNPVERRLIAILRWNGKGVVCEGCSASPGKSKFYEFRIKHKNGIMTDNRWENIEVLCRICMPESEYPNGEKILHDGSNASRLDIIRALSNKGRQECERCQVDGTGNPKKEFCDENWYFPRRDPSELLVHYKNGEIGNNSEDNLELVCRSCIKDPQKLFNNKQSKRVFVKKLTQLFYEHGVPYCDECHEPDGYYLRRMWRPFVIIPKDNNYNNVTIGNAKLLCEACNSKKSKN
jgi:hypothetical protein